MCTYKRKTLELTLESLVTQSLPDGYSLEVVVVDNDIEASGRAFVEACAAKTDVPINYTVNAERNLAHVRNSTMENAKGELFAFIDDDEWASDDKWLAKLVGSMKEFDVDAVFGEVEVHYPDDAPQWIVDGDLLGKIKYPHGTKVVKGATSNGLLKAHWVREKGFKFDPFFGKSGGEDTDLFSRIYKSGGRFVYDAHASVEEMAEPQRLNFEYIRKLNVRVGQTHYHYLWSRQTGFASFKTGLFVLAQIGGYGLLALLSWPVSRSRRMRYHLLFLRNIEKLRMKFAGGGKSVELYGTD